MIKLQFHYSLLNRIYSMYKKEYVELISFIC